MSTNFSKFGQNFTVYVQPINPFVAIGPAIGRLTVLQQSGPMVPISSFMDFQTRSRVPRSPRNTTLTPTATIIGARRPAIVRVRLWAARAFGGQGALPAGWRLRMDRGVLSGKARRRARSRWVFGLALLLVYLVLAGQYESWLTPIPVLLAVPLALFGTVAMLSLVRPAEQHLCANRARAAHRAVGEKRDPDRRSGARAAPRRNVRSYTPRSRARGGDSARS